MKPRRESVLFLTGIALFAALAVGCWSSGDAGRTGTDASADTDTGSDTDTDADADADADTDTDADTDADTDGDADMDAGHDGGTDEDAGADAGAGACVVRIELTAFFPPGGCTLTVWVRCDGVPLSGFDPGDPWDTVHADVPGTCDGGGHDTYEAQYAFEWQGSVCELCLDSGPGGKMSGPCTPLEKSCGKTIEVAYDACALPDGGDPPYDTSTCGDGGQ